MDIFDSAFKIVACSSASTAPPCTASMGNVCTAASSNMGGVVCSLPACPTIMEGSDWNVWSASCAMSSTYNVNSGKTVKIKKSSSMSGELVIDRGATSGFANQHFDVWGTLEMEDVTLTGGYATVSSFCSLHSL